jgi:hypothetical protein
MVISCGVKMSHPDTQFDYVTGNVTRRCQLQRCLCSGFVDKTNLENNSLSCEMAAMLKNILSFLTIG